MRVRRGVGGVGCLAGDLSDDNEDEVTNYIEDIRSTVVVMYCIHGLRLRTVMKCFTMISSWYSCVRSGTVRVLVR